MTTLRERMDSLPMARRKKAEKRAKGLIAEATGIAPLDKDGLR